MKSFISILVLVALAVVTAQKSGRHTANFQHYYDLDETENFIQDMADDNPGSVFVEEIGQTAEGRSIKALRVSFNSSRKGEKPMIVVESGLRAREWIAPMVNLYFVHMLLEHDDYQNLLSKVDFMFIPVANPDGFVYSHTTDRNWNKNRRSVGSDCFGVDINRNFGFKFIAGDDSCSENFAGESAASEAETQAIQNVLAKYQNRIKLYLSLQAFGQKILLPYNYRPVAAPNLGKLIPRAVKTAVKIYRKNNTMYQVAIGGRISPESGTSSDYAYGNAKIPAVFTFKLPRGGKSGYEVPADKLDGILQETFEGLLEMVKLPRV